MLLLMTWSGITPAEEKPLDLVIKQQRAVIAWPQTEHERPQVNWYWQQIRKIAATQFSGMDMELAVSPSYKTGGDDEGFLLGATIPLYSKEKKLARNKAARNFLDEGAKLCAQLEEALRTYLIYQQAYSNYEMLAQDEGSDILDKLVKVQVDIVKQEALITQSHRQLQSFIAPFCSEVKILGWEKAK
ncbi:MAG: hypothetical protein R2941_17440 [Desulfobacterales bacterium]